MADVHHGFVCSVLHVFEFSVFREQSENSDDEWRRMYTAYVGYIHSCVDEYE